VALPDIAIKPNGNFFITQNSKLGIVAGLSRINQDIYRAMVESPSQLIIGNRYRNNIEIESALRNYLSAVLSRQLPFPVSQINITTKRNPDESVSITLLLPTTEGQSSNIPIELKFLGREGTQLQIVYDFNPIVAEFPQTTRTVTERIVVTNRSIRVPLTFIYSGIGPILFFGESQIPEFDTAEINISKIENVRKYNILDFYTNDFVVDSITVLSGSEVLELRSSDDRPGVETLVPMEDGTPFIYFKKDAPTGSVARVRVHASNGTTYASSADLVQEPNVEHVFGLKVNRTISIALLASPLDPGIYKCTYNAKIRYKGDPD